MQTVTKNLVAPDLRKFSAEYHVAESFDEIQATAAANGVSLAELNDAMRGLRRSVYIDALSKTVDAKLEQFVKNAVATGVMTAEEATALAESKRAQLASQLPNGLKPVLDENGNQAYGKKKGRAAVKAA